MYTGITGTLPKVFLLKREKREWGKKSFYKEGRDYKSVKKKWVTVYTRDDGLFIFEHPNR